MKSKSNPKGYAALSAMLRREREKGKRLEGKLTEMYSDEMLYELVKNNQAVRDRVISDYLNSLAARKNPRLVGGGIATLTPTHRPKSLADAKRLAERMIKY
ncbi:MAG: hypothetical protein E7350_02215 [Clostridiales bacterium]|nr:hypothetical protein [Clostridiales bacterium]